MKRRIQEFCLNVEDADTLSAFLQERMTNEESAQPIGDLAHRLYHWVREHPDL